MKTIDFAAKPAETFASYLIELRQRMGMSQIRFANEVGYSHGLISQLEAGADPSIRFLRALGDRFGMAYLPLCLLVWPDPNLSPEFKMPLMKELDE